MMRRSSRRRNSVGESSNEDVFCRLDQILRFQPKENNNPFTCPRDAKTNLRKSLLVKVASKKQERNILCSTPKVQRQPEDTFPNDISAINSSDINPIKNVDENNAENLSDKNIYRTKGSNKLILGKELNKTTDPKKSKDLVVLLNSYDNSPTKCEKNEDNVQLEKRSLKENTEKKHLPQSNSSDEDQCDVTKPNSSVINITDSTEGTPKTSNNLIQPINDKSASNIFTTSPKSLENLGSSREQKVLEDSPQTREHIASDRSPRTPPSQNISRKITPRKSKHSKSYKRTNINEVSKILPVANRESVHLENSNDVQDLSHDLDTSELVNQKRNKTKQDVLEATTLSKRKTPGDKVMVVVNNLLLQASQSKNKSNSNDNTINKENVEKPAEISPVQLQSIHTDNVEDSDNSSRASSYSDFNTFDQQVLYKTLPSADNNFNFSSSLNDIPIKNWEGPWRPDIEEGLFQMDGTSIPQNIFQRSHKTNETYYDKNKKRMQRKKSQYGRLNHVSNKSHLLNDQQQPAHTDNSFDSTLILNNVEQEVSNDNATITTTPKRKIVTDKNNVAHGKSNNAVRVINSSKTTTKEKSEINIISTYVSKRNTPTEEINVVPEKSNNNMTIANTSKRKILTKENNAVLENSNNNVTIVNTSKRTIPTEENNAILEKSNNKATTANTSRRKILSEKNDTVLEKSNNNVTVVNISRRKIPTEENKAVLEKSNNNLIGNTSKIKILTGENISVLEEANNDVTITNTSKRKIPKEENKAVLEEAYNKVTIASTSKRKIPEEESNVTLEKSNHNDDTIVNASKRNFPTEETNGVLDKSNNNISIAPKEKNPSQKNKSIQSNDVGTQVSKTQNEEVTEINLDIATLNKSLKTIKDIASELSLLHSASGSRRQMTQNTEDGDETATDQNNGIRKSVRKKTVSKSVLLYDCHVLEKRIFKVPDNKRKKRITKNVEPVRPEGNSKKDRKKKAVVSSVNKENEQQLSNNIPSLDDNQEPFMEYATEENEPHITSTSNLQKTSTTAKGKNEEFLSRKDSTITQNSEQKQHIEKAMKESNYNDEPDITSTSKPNITTTAKRRGRKKKVTSEVHTNTQTRTVSLINNVNDIQNPNVETRKDEENYESQLISTSKPEENTVPKRRGRKKKVTAEVHSIINTEAKASLMNNDRFDIQETRTGSAITNTLDIVDMDNVGNNHNPNIETRKGEENCESDFITTSKPEENTIPKRRGRRKKVTTEVNFIINTQSKTSLMSNDRFDIQETRTGSAITNTLDIVNMNNINDSQNPNIETRKDGESYESHFISTSIPEENTILKRRGRKKKVPTDGSGNANENLNKFSIEGVFLNNLDNADCMQNKHEMEVPLETNEYTDRLSVVSSPIPKKRGRKSNLERARRKAVESAAESRTINATEGLFDRCSVMRSSFGSVLYNSVNNTIPNQTILSSVLHNCDGNSVGYFRLRPQSPTLGQMTSKSNLYFVTLIGQGIITFNDQDYHIFESENTVVKVPADNDYTITNVDDSKTLQLLYIKN
ncbi:putative uncharacterized protein DDB_G0282133 isoform X2 [Aethina tumida]|uniref:putative uncharacterized protein DDB_G0282133 isoform X2 n=1 Tax=Aethina tumida TaxID=116153 RepID=UPI00096B0FCB|nr:putative uncharacterized protein DDB_G0282133 isoform X2 [Aethina tumida]